MSAEIYFFQGHVYHGRIETAENAFRYPILNLYFDMDQWSLLRQKLRAQFFGLLSISAEDYLESNSSDLRPEVTKWVKEKFAYEAEEVFLQTLPRMFGYVFNPVNFWYFRKNKKLEAVLCEVHNTFGEKHYYWLYRQGQELNHLWLEAHKEFHVSPFFNVDGKYRFRFSITDEGIEAAINLYNQDNSLRLATWVKGDLKNIEELSLLQILIRYGWMTPLVVLRIHYQAVKLFFKKVKFYRKPHPPVTEVTYETGFDRR